MNIKNLIAMLFFSFSLETSASFFSGNELNKFMESGENGNHFHDGLVIGYISGVVDAGNKYLFCLPSNVTVRQFVAVAQKHIKDHPERWDLAGESLVTDALSGAFPCPNKK